LKSAKKVMAVVDPSTEQKIKHAARKVFIKKGYSATTREIADVAGINNALLNYYFRKKEMLFDIIIKEEIIRIYSRIFPIVNDKQITLKNKIKLIIETYTELLVPEPGLINFILAEIQYQPERFAALSTANGGFKESVMGKQIEKARPDVDTTQMIMTLIGMVLFPFVGRPILQKVSGLTEKEFGELLTARVEFLIPLINGILKL
jgi:AcrR family transcriptional regulator